MQELLGMTWMLGVLLKILPQMTLEKLKGEVFRLLFRRVIKRWMT
jgi:hypothetical protein